jgi:hypothetical protein
MRFLKRQVINRRSPSDGRLVVDVNNGVVMDTTNSLRLPIGTGDRLYSIGAPENQRPIEPEVGMIRYNTSYDQVEVYQGTGAQAKWRALRFQEAGKIVQQDLGNGDWVEVLFGPLNPPPGFIYGYTPGGGGSTAGGALDAPPIQNNATWTGSNILVFVENVFQIYNTNYTIVVDPPGFKPGGGSIPYDPGSYISFDSAVPTGKAVTVLHGFDS